MQTIKIATRKSALAMWQAQHVATLLQQLAPASKVELVQFTTRGDKILDAPLAKIGGKGLFVKELEHALLDGSADIAVHSMKDVPMHFPAGLQLSAVLARANVHDALVSNTYSNLASLPQGATLGSSSLRRQVQILKIRPDLKIHSLRGNVNSRLAKLDAGEFAAIILAAAGLERLGLAARISELLPTSLSLPAVGQGVIGIESRADALQLNALLAKLNHPPSAIRLTAERAMNNTLNGGCQAPIAGFAELVGDKLELKGMVGDLHGKQIFATLSQQLGADYQQNLVLAARLGVALGEQLLQDGAAAILAQLIANIDVKA